MIGYYAHHHGSGHVQRLRTIAARSKTPVTGLSSLPRPADWSGSWVVLPRDDDPVPDVTADVTANGRLHWAPTGHAGYSARMAAIAEWVATARPQFVVVDVSVEVTMLVRALGVPVVVAAMRGDRSDPAHVLAYDVARALLAPWPSSLPESQWPDRWRAKTIHTGAFSRFDALPSAGLPVQAGSVVCLLGSGGADLPPDFAASVTAATPGWEWTFCGGGFGASRTPLDEVLRGAQVVVTHAGQNAVAEVAALRRPAVVVAQPRPHDEQLATVRALHTGGLAVTCEQWPATAQWPGLLADAVELGGTGWPRWNDHGGAQRAAATLDEMASR